MCTCGGHMGISNTFWHKSKPFKRLVSPTFSPGLKTLWGFLISFFFYAKPFNPGWYYQPLVSGERPLSWFLIYEFSQLGLLVCFPAVKRSEYIKDDDPRSMMVTRSTVWLTWGDEEGDEQQEDQHRLLPPGAHLDHHIRLMRDGASLQDDILVLGSSIDPLFRYIPALAAGW